jgi:hypothetical protein
VLLVVRDELRRFFRSDCAFSFECLARTGWKGKCKSVGSALSLRMYYFSLQAQKGSSAKAERRRGFEWLVSEARVRAKRNKIKAYCRCKLASLDPVTMLFNVDLKGQLLRGKMNPIVT